MPDEGEMSAWKICGIPVKTVTLGNMCGAVWIIFGVTQTVIGFSRNGTCDANEELPIYNGVHGLLNMVYGIGMILFVGHGYKLFVFRLVFYLAWIAEGALCITGFAFYSKTVGYLKGCSTQCKTCSKDLVTGSIVIESFISFLYILVSFSIIGFEIKTMCKHCKLGDGNTERGHDTVPRARSQFRQRETRRTEQTHVSRGLDIARRITDHTSEDQIRGHNTIHIHNMYLSAAPQAPFDFSIF